MVCSCPAIWRASNSWTAEEERCVFADDSGAGVLPCSSAREVLSVFLLFSACVAEDLEVVNIFDAMLGNVRKEEDHD